MPTTAVDVTATAATTRESRTVHLALAALAWLPLLFTARGVVAADTRQHLYLDPGEFIDRARSIWDPFVHMGTVTHQNLGLISPMGAWFWFVDASGLPMWVGQRLWVGAIIFAAAAGVLHLGRTLGWAVSGATASALVYGTSPYLLQYATRTSVLLLPFAGLPWLVSFTVRAARTGRWRPAAACALVVFLVGSVNATSLIMVGLAPVLWLGYVAVSGEESIGRALATGARIGVLCAGVSAWWIVGLAVQSRHGLPVLTYTETLDQVAVTSAATEVLRGLGYWVFYGREVLDPNVGAAVAYMQNPLLLAITYGIPFVAITAAVTVRFRHRGYFALLVVVGTIVAVGAFPADDPSLGGTLFREAADTTAGLALRSSTRAVPIVVLGLAVFVGRGVDALRVPPRVRWQAVGAVGVIAVAGLPALVTGGFVDPNFARPTDLPEHWEAAAAHLEAEAPVGAVLEVPGIQFTTYRWGTTYEPVTPALIDHPVIAREQLPYGSPASADLLIALDRRFQEGLVEPAAIAPVARLLGAAWVLLRNDLAFERYVSPRPRRLWADLQPLPADLRPEASFGEPVPNTPDPRLPLLDEEALGLDPDVRDPSPVELLAVDEPRGRLRAAATDHPVVIDGDGEGVVDAAAAGLLAGQRVVLYGQSLLEDDDLRRTTLDDSPSLVYTDSARKRERRWRSVRWSTGYTERADEQRPASTLGDGDLTVFDDIEPSAQTTVIQQGARVDASTYGGPFTLDPDVRPALAVDGRADTAWVVGPFSDPRGESITIRPDLPTDGPVVLTQFRGPNHITEVDVTVDDGAPQRIVLDDRSLTDDGQPLDVPATGIATLTIEIVATSGDPTSGAPVGLAEISIGGLQVVEVVQLPTGLVDDVGTSMPMAPVSYVMTRLRSDPFEPVRGDEEDALRRRFRVGTTREFTVEGSVRLAGAAASATLDTAIGTSGPAIDASTVLPGDLDSRGAAAFDGDPTTAWRPAFLDLEGSWLSVDAGRSVTIDTLDVTIIDDGDHSVPTEFELTVDGRSQLVAVPPGTGDASTGTRAITVPVTPMTGTDIRLSITAAEHRLTTDYYTRAPIATPIGVAEFVVPGVDAVSVAATIDTGCRSDLLSVDGLAVAIRVRGTTADALAGRPLAFEACDAVQLVTGDHDLQAAPGSATAFDLDRIVLRTVEDESADGSADGPADERASALTDVEMTSSTRYEATLDPGGDTYVVLAQSHEAGWTLRVDGVDQGAPTLVDGGFNGWRVPASRAIRTVEVEWTPQRAVDRAILVTAAFLLVALALQATGRRAGGDRVAADRPGFGLAGARQRPPATAAVILGCTAVAGTLTLGAAGFLLGGSAALIALRGRRGRQLVAGATAAAWAIAAGWVIIEQVLRPRRPDFEWAAGLVGPNRLALAAIVLLTASVLVADRTPEPTS